MLVKDVFALDLVKIYKPAESLGGTNATLSNLINPIINNVLIISGILALATIFLAGFSFITSEGDKAKIAQASSAITYGIIGLVVVVAAFLITRLLGAILGFTFF